MTHSLAASLTEATMRLAMLRESIRQRSERIAEARQAFERGIAHELEGLTADKAAAELEEATVRGMAMVVWETEGAKRPAPGIEVIVQKEYAIDEAAGLTWAKATRMCLVPEQLDAKAVKKMAAVVALPFVEVRERPAVRIATDLLRAMDAAANPVQEAA